MKKLDCFRRQLGWMLPLLLLSGPLAHAAADYLPAVGPVPLRWQPAIVFRPALLAALPPLAMGREVSSAVAPRSEPSPGSRRPAGGETNQLADAHGSTSTNTTPAFSGETSPFPELPQLLPQLFYAVPATNAAAAQLPINFIPPLPPPARSSSANYTTEKP